MEKSRKELGEQIRKLRKSANFTQEELGEKTGLNYKYIGELERGMVNVSLDSIKKIAVALGISIADLFFQKKPMPAGLKKKSPSLRISTPDIRLLKKTICLLNKILTKNKTL